jgi:adenylate cyclase
MNYFKLLKSALRRDVYGGLVGASLAIVAGLVAWWWFPPLARWSYDIPFNFLPVIESSDVIMVYMDEESHDQLKQPYDKKWDRALHANLLDKLRKDGAKMVVFDIIFSDSSTNIQSYQLLAQAMKNHGKVVIGSEAISREKFFGAIDSKRISWPYELFRETAAGVGIVNMTADVDFGIRGLLTGVNDEDQFVPSLGLVSARIAGAKNTRKYEDPRADYWIRYHGAPGMFPAISYYLALAPDGTAPGFFKDKIVVIGARQSTGFTGQGKDEFASPYIFGRFYPGADVQATMILNLLNDQALKTIPGSWQIFLLVLIGGGLGWALPQFRPAWSALGALLAMLAIPVLAMLLMHKFNYWFTWTVLVVIQIPLVLVWAVLFHTMRLHFEKQILAESLALHLEPARVQELLRHPELLKPHATKRVISILWTDIAAYSKISGQLDADDLVLILNKYYEHALKCVHDHEGTVVKLIGDAIFAIWNAPLDQADHQRRACQSALLLVKELVTFDEIHRGIPMRTRVGLHCGEACVGNIGSSKRFDYTAIGEAVNMASRLEGLNRHLGTTVLATRDICKNSEDVIVTRLVGYFKFKGIESITEIYEIVGLKENEAQYSALRDTFADGLSLFMRRQWDGAEEIFKKMSEDGPAKFYLDRIKELRVIPPPYDWTGWIELKEK